MNDAPAEVSADASTPRRSAHVALARGAVSLAGLLLAGLLLAGLLCGWALWLLVAASERVGGIDFAFYVVNARDVADGLAEALQARYFYAPGSYGVWVLIMRVLGRTLPNLQHGYVAVLVGVAAATGAVVFFATRRSCLALLAAALTAASLVRIEGLEGITEPFVVLTFLVGTLAFGLLWKRGHQRAGVLALALTVALCLFIKQQGALLGAGAAVALLPLLRTCPRPRAAGLVGLGVLATVVTVVALWTLEGGGVRALEQALRSPGGYAATGTFVDNVLSVGTRLRGLAAAVLLSAGAFLAAGRTVHARAWRALGGAEGSVAAVVVLGGCATLVQFTARAYAHYAILGLPGAVVLGAALLSWSWSTPSRAARGLALAAVAAMVATTLQEPWSIARASPPYAAAVAVLEPVCAQVKPGEEVLVMPGHLNIVHLACGTRSTHRPDGYGWGDAGIAPAAQAAIVDRFDAVVLLPTGDAHPEIRDAARAAGFTPVTASVLRRIR